MLVWPGRAGLNWDVGTGMGMVEGHPLGRSSGSSRRAAHTQLVTAHQPSWAELGSSNYRAPAEDLQLLSGRSILSLD